MNKLRLLQLRKENNMTQDELCKILFERYSYEVNKSIISRYEKGVHEPNFYFVDLVSSVFGVTSDYMMGRSENKYPSENEKKRIPVLYDVMSEPLSLVAESMAEYECTNDDCDFCLKAKDDSMMGARIHEGDLVFIHRQTDVEHGDIVAVMIGNEGAILRRVFVVNSNIILHPENPSYQDSIYSKKDFKQVKVLGKVRYFKAEVK
jgi:repressor LexA